MKKKLADLYRNLRWGIAGGLTFSIVFCLWVVVLIILNRSFTIPVGSGESAHAGIIALTYLWGGAAAGALVGLLRPLVRSSLGAPIVGMVAAVPVFAGVRIGLKGFVPLDREDIVVFGLLSIIAGGLAGAILREVLGGDDPPPVRDA